MVVLALLVPVMLMLLMLALDLFEDLLFPSPPPPPADDKPTKQVDSHDHGQQDT
ncbi:hypothetical protein ACIQWL_33270 [Streptomyces mirabilis]|uniref:hypothetical protein n=1 Tax=Streptomyces mirabilis TaxID=68239 RepID=UPI002253B602|nr:hypothetical protein [Streptomyces mirabilis]MCX4419156.1 hypothetical protein [Streptomyces mirabilis]